MKKNKNKVCDLFVVVYFNCWYLPLLVFLLGLKICLISMLADSIKNHQKEYVQYNRKSVQQKSNSLPYHGNSKNFSHKQISSYSFPTLTESPEQIEEWKILANLTNADIVPTAANRTDAESIWLVFNRLPRCAGGTVVNLLEKLSQNNRFTHQEHEYHTPWPRFLLDKEQESLVTWFEYQHLPKSYDRHFYFVNFTHFQKYVKEKPIYMNMVRDPVYRLRSYFLGKRMEPAIVKMEMHRRDKLLPGSGLEWYNKDFEVCVLKLDPECSFANGTMDFTLAIPFFCGQQNSCVVIDDKWALQKAKFVIEKHYSVVGVLEKMNETLTVLENYIPKFFSGVTQLYQESEDKYTNRNVKNTAPISSAVRQIIETKLPHEVELYQFICQRLEKQFHHIR